MPASYTQPMAYGSYGGYGYPAMGAPAAGGSVPPAGGQ
eukprot:CAMPEP_0173463102 /NCGR_PEP_ID=MMETSP1357-20121228/67793_1 /TAXON_ID=77926 /ORGANISM="Hemiselmis rufescens, Strain PCC563" /LENGTH=37 /DNA_ID= /DNA_START= /DNA_END= /DNA_ORIENTATION=